MKKLDKYVLIKLGFDEVIVSAEESGDVPFVYYTKDLNDHESLITNSMNFPISGEEIFTVELFNTDLGVCNTEEEVKILYKALLRKEL